MKRIVFAVALCLSLPAWAVEETLTSGSPTSSTIRCHPGYKLGYLYRGTFDSATAVVQSEDNDEDWNDVPDTSSPSATGGVVTCFADTSNYRITTSGGGGSQSLEIELQSFSSK